MNSIQLLKKMISNKLYSMQYGFFGDYSSWSEARKESTGYDARLILDKVKSSALKVKSGEAAYERDSVLFDRIYYSWPLLTALLWIASQDGNELDLIDLGGSLGTSYYQNRSFLCHLKKLQWSIVEQKNFVECGREIFENEDIKFYYSIDECLKERFPDTIILSGVIQCLENPYEKMEEIVKKEFKYIIFDRIPLLSKGKDRLTIQKVPTNIYDASYPVWLLNEEKFLGYMLQEYTLVADFEALGKTNVPGCFYKGFIFQSKE